MDNLDVKLKAASSRQPRAEASVSDSGSTSRTPAFNAPATVSYLDLLSRERGLLSEGLTRTLNTLQNSLNEYVKNPASAASAPADAQADAQGLYRRLTSQVISRDPQLQEKVAQSLSTAHNLVRSRDAATVLEGSLRQLPDALREGTAAGRTLSRFICESLVDLTDHQSMGAGLERDLAVRGVYAPQTPLSARSKQATERVLSTSIAYVGSNQPKALEQLPRNLQQGSTRQPGTTTPQIMTRYLRQALQQFPEDSTYLDIFKQNRSSQEDTPYQDKLSKETAERIHNLISKAAETARRGNLIPGSGRQTQAVRAPAMSEAAGQVDARELTLSELSARAARLQQQFREERQRMVSEGRLPDPAARPQPAPQSAEPRQSSQGRSEVLTPSSLARASMNVTYTAVQSSSFGTLSSVPGMTVPVQSSAAQTIADSSQVQDLSGSRTLSKVLHEQQRTGGSASDPQSPPPMPLSGRQSSEAQASSRQNTADQAAAPQSAQNTQAAQPALTPEEISALKDLARKADEIRAAEERLSRQKAEVERQAAANAAQAEQLKAQAEANAAQAAELRQQEAELSARQAVPPAAQNVPNAVQPPAVSQAQAASPAVTPAPAAAPDTAAPGAMTLAERAYAESQVQSALRAEAQEAAVPAEEPAVLTEEVPPAEDAEVMNAADETAADDTPADDTPADEETLKAAVQDLPDESLVSPESSGSAEDLSDGAAALNAALGGILTPAAPASPQPAAQAVPQMPTQMTAQQKALLGAETADLGGDTGEMLPDAEDMAEALDETADELTEPADDAEKAAADSRAGRTAGAEAPGAQVLPPAGQELKNPGAASVTTGQSAPVPEPSEVPAAAPAKEEGLLHRIASLFGLGGSREAAQAGEAAQTAQAVATEQQNLQSVRSNPIDQMMYTLRVVTENPNLPPGIRDQALRLQQALQNPVADLQSVNNWLNFVTGPLSPSSPQALALHQWAFTLLSIRLSQIGKRVSKFVKTTDAAGLDQEIGELRKAVSGKSSKLDESLDETLTQIKRLQTLRDSHEAGQPFARYIPLPPQYEGGREGGLRLKRQNDGSEESWHLNFNFDLPGLGPIEIRAVARLPELMITAVAETLSGLQKVQECLPLLKKRLQSLGITTRSSSARLGRIGESEAPADTPAQPAHDSSMLSVDI